MYTKGVDFTITSGESALTGAEAQVVVLFADIRGFSTWSNTAPIAQIGELIKVQYERVIQICNDHHHCFHKFLGDGFLLLWEASEDMSRELCLQLALDAAFHVHKKYWHFSQATRYSVPTGYGIGISMGRAIRIQPETFLKEMNEVDFLGYPLNCAARMQSLSGPFGVTVCSRTAIELSAHPGDYLYPETPGFRRLLHAPAPGAQEKARVANGLMDEDRRDFRHLSWPDARRDLWSTDGLLVGA